MIRGAPISVLLAILTGCGTNAVSQQALLADKTRAQAEADCHRRYPDPLAKPSLPRITCLNQVALAYHQSISPYVEAQYLDLVQLVTSQTVVAAERYDAGQMTGAEFQLEVARINTGYQSSVASRMQNQQMVSAAQTQANAAVYQSIAAQQQAAAAQRQANQSSLPTTCIKTGNMVTCN